MNKKLLALFLILIIIISALVGCSQPAQESEEVSVEEIPNQSTLKWNIGKEPKTIDPILNSTSDGGNIINQTFEGLVREKNGRVYPGIAEEWKISEDGLTVIFKLRESNWSDGSPLTANDFVYSWKRGMDRETASENSWIWEYTNILGAFDAVNGGSLDEVGVSALDDYTLEIKLDKPTDYIVSLLSFYHFLPTKQSAVEAGADGTWAKDSNLVVSNGPFTLRDYTTGGLTLVKNPEYWNSLGVKIDRIDCKFIDDKEKAYQAYQSGELDFLSEVPPAEISSLMTENPDFYVFPLLESYYYNFNMDLDLFKNPSIRRAINLAIDRDLICRTIRLEKVTLPAVGLLPPGLLDHEGYDFAEKSGTYGLVTDASKVKEAQKLLANAGYPNGEAFPEFSISYNTLESHQKVAELVKEMLETNLGIKVNLESQDWAVFQDTRKQGDYQVARGGWLTDFMDPMGFLAIFASYNNDNDSNFSNARYDELIDIASKTRGEEHFQALYEAQDILMNKLPIIPIYHNTDVMLVSSKLQGWDRSVLGTLDFSLAEIVE